MFIDATSAREHMAVWPQLQTRPTSFCARLTLPLQSAFVDYSISLDPVGAFQFVLVPVSNSQVRSSYREEKIWQDEDRTI
jgi:hypothetical protein